MNYLHFFKTVFASTSEYFYLKDKECRYRAANPAFLKFIEYTDKEIVGKNDNELFSAKISNFHSKGDSDLLNSSSPKSLIWHEDIFIKGDIIWLEVKKSSFFNQNGKCDGILCSIKDITKQKRAESEYIESENKYKMLVKNLPSMVYKGFKDWSVEFYDKKINIFTGYDADLFNSRKMKWIDIIVKEDIETAKNCFIQALKTDKLYIREYRIKSADGVIKWTQERGYIVCNDKGEIKYASGVFFDITDHKNAEDALKNSEEKARALLNATTEGVVLLDSQGLILDINDTFARRFNKNPQELLGSCIWDLNPPKPMEPRKANLNWVFKKGRQFRNVVEQRGVWNDIKLYPVCNSEGQVTRIAVFSHDITDLKLAERQIRNLTQQLMKAQEDERQLIARELHDNIAQDLSLLKIGFETIFDDYPFIDSKMKQKSSGLSKILQKTITTVRDMAYDLRPPGLDQLGLVRTVYQYCEEFSEKSELEIDFFAAGLADSKLLFDTEINLYRLIQEALWNIHKHAKASHVTIKMVASFPKIILRIEDNGKGFDVKNRLAAISQSREKRMGLRSMEERVSLLEGKLKIQSRISEGTKILIEVPHREEYRDGEKEYSNH